MEWEALYNPAFIALILRLASAEHARRVNAPLPFALSFLVPPIVLHEPTRAALPAQARSKMGVWLDNNPVLRAGLGARAASLAPAVRAGIRYGIHSGALTLDETGLGAPRRTRRNSDVALSTEVEDIIKRAGYVGGWFALAGSASSIYALWRVRP